MSLMFNLTPSGGTVVVTISSVENLNEHTLELYLFDFRKGEYSKKPYVTQTIDDSIFSKQEGVYRFTCELSRNNMVKGVIKNADEVISSRVRYIGDRHKIKVEVENTEDGYLYKIKSDLAISKKLIFYKPPGSTTRIHLPADLEVGEPLMFVIKPKDFAPKFEYSSEFIDCFNIER